MIYVNRGKTKFEGRRIDLMAELTCLVNEMLKSGFSEEDLDLCVETAKKSDEQLGQEVAQIKEDFNKSCFGQLITSLFD